MQHVIDSARAALSHRNWYAALAVALTLPDVCGACEGIDGHERRYLEFFNRYLKDYYTVTRKDFSKPKAAVESYHISRSKAKTQEERDAALKKFNDDWDADCRVDEYRSISMLAGHDLFALRSSIVHEGGLLIDRSGRRGVNRQYRKFHVRAPEEGHQIHCNSANEDLQIDIGIICEQICAAAEKGLSENKKGRT